MRRHTGEQVAVVQARPRGVAPPVQVVHAGKVGGSNLGSSDSDGLGWILMDSDGLGWTRMDSDGFMKSPVWALRQSPCWTSPSWWWSRSGACRGCTSASWVSNAWPLEVVRFAGGQGGVIGFSMLGGGVTGLDEFCGGNGEFSSDLYQGPSEEDVY